MILVTGCAGFIGSNLCIELIKRGYGVIGIDALFKGSNINNLNSIINDKNFYFIKVDLNQYKYFNDKLTNPFVKYSNNIDYIIHLAAESHVDRSIDWDRPFLETNIIGTSNILKFALENDIKIISQISDEVFGPIKEGKSFEEDKLLPTSPYATSKAAQYLIGKSYQKTYGLKVISTFPSNTFGPRQYPEKLIPRFIINLLSNKKIPLMQSSHHIRDWLPVETHIDALIFLMKNGNPGEDYNIGGFWSLKNIEITKLLLKLCGKDESYIETVPDRKSHDSRYCVNDNKIQKLGWYKNPDNWCIESYLKEIINWYKKEYDL